MVRSDGTVHLSTGTGFGAPVPWGVGMPPYALFPSAGDINGDGLADILWSDGNSTMFVQFSTGNGFGGVIQVGSAPQYACDDFGRSEEHTSELQSLTNLVCRLLLEKKNAKSRARTPRRRRPPWGCPLPCTSWPPRR